MALNLSGVFADVGNLASGVTGQNLIESLLAGAAGTVVLSGLKTPDGQNAVDPLHIFVHQPTPGANAGAVQGVVQGSNVMTMSQFLALSPDNQKMIQALKYTIIPG